VKQCVEYTVSCEQTFSGTQTLFTSKQTNTLVTQESSTAQTGTLIRLLLQYSVIIHAIDPSLSSSTSIKAKMVASDEYIASLPESDVSSLSDLQEKIISLAMLPSAFLSVFGSSVVAHLVVKEKKNSPYRRILFALSICDIIASINIALAPYLVPADESQWIWSVGNSGTCNMVGALQQFSFSTQLYSGMLGLYFLLTVQYQWKQEDYGRRIEPWLHAFIVVFSISTAAVGAVFGFYNPLDLGPGCWVNSWPEGCGTDSWDYAGPCKSVLIAWVFGGLPSVSMLLLIVVSNLLLYCYVRRTMLRGLRYDFTLSSSSDRNFQNTRSS